MKYEGKIPGAPNFTYEELIRSDTANRYNLNNRPKVDEIYVRLGFLARTVLQPARDHFGVPIVVTSGYRCAAVNNVVGGSPTSWHTEGCAADIRFERKSGLKDSELFRWIHDNCCYVELIAEGIPSGWVHVAALQGESRPEKTKYMLDKEGVVHTAPFDKIMNIYASYHC